MVLPLTNENASFSNFAQFGQSQYLSKVYLLNLTYKSQFRGCYYFEIIKAEGAIRVRTWFEVKIMVKIRDIDRFRVRIGVKVRILVRNIIITKSKKK